MIRARLVAVGIAATLALAGHVQSAVVPVRPAAALSHPVGLVVGVPAEGAQGYRWVPGTSWSGPAGLPDVADTGHAPVTVPHANTDAVAIGSATAAMLLLRTQPEPTDRGDLPIHAYLLSAGEYVLAVGTLAAEVPPSTQVSAVPLPGAIWLFGSALLAFLGISSRHRL